MSNNKLPFGVRLIFGLIIAIAVAVTSVIVVNNIGEADGAKAQPTASTAVPAPTTTDQAPNGVDQAVWNVLVDAANEKGTDFDIAIASTGDIYLGFTLKSNLSDAPCVPPGGSDATWQALIKSLVDREIGIDSVGYPRLSGEGKVTLHSFVLYYPAANLNDGAKAATELLEYVWSQPLTCAV